MAYPRRQLNATLLADGTVFVNGGTSVTGFTEESGALLAAESWNPATGTWRTLASGRIIRVYHSATLLLADGRVLVAGSGEGSNATTQLTAEIYSPPYLFDSRGKPANRLTITSLPASVGYAQRFLVGTSQPRSIAKVHGIRLGSVTHAFNQSQLFSRLSFTGARGGALVTAPSSRTASPPGHYLLFVLDKNGVPSVGKIVRVG